MRRETAAGVTFLATALFFLIFGLQLPLGTPARVGAGFLPVLGGGLLLVLALVILVMGCFLEGISIIVLTSSVMLPMVQGAGIDMIWFGIFLVVLIEAAQITPPVGFNLFVLQSITGRDIIRVTIATIPYFLLLMVLLVMITIFPQIVLVLPQNL